MRTVNLSRNRKSALLLLLGAIAVSAAFPPPASAGQYQVVDACKNAGDAFRVRAAFGIEGPGIPFGFFVENACQPFADGAIDFLVDRNSQGGMEWAIIAPPSTRIRGVDYKRLLDLPMAGSRYRWTFFWVRPGGNEEPLENEVFTPQGPTVTTMSHHQPSFDAVAILGRIVCDLSDINGNPALCTAPNNPAARAKASDFVLTMEDSVSPFFTALGGSLFSEDEVRGTHTVTYSARDGGAGIARALLVVDGVEQPAVPDPNGGKCVEPYLFMVPCKLEVSSSFQLDTTRLSEGPHEVKVAVIDAAGNRRESPAAAFAVHNAPSNVGQPTISGSPTVGSKLQADPGTWEGEPRTFNYQWLRCPPEAERISECGPISGATGSEYQLGREDLEHRALAQVTAINEAGSGSAFTDATPLVESDGPRGNRPPILSRVRLTRKAFPANGRTSLKFSSSKPGRLTIAIASRRNPRKSVKTLKRQLKAGPGKVVLTGRVGRRTMRPGRYRLLAFVTDANGDASKPVQRSFRILAR